MNIIELTGWIAVASLVVVLIAQSTALRLFTRPRRGDSNDRPSLTVVVIATHDETTTRHTISSVAALDYPGPVEILLVPASPRGDLQPLALVSSRVRVLDHSVSGIERWDQLTRDSNRDWFLILETPLRLDPDAASRLVSEAVAEDLDACALFPRLEIGFGLETLTTPLVPWLSLTFSSLLGGSRRTVSTTAAALLVRREVCQSSESTLDDHLVIDRTWRLRTKDGYDSMYRGAFSYRETSRCLAATAGNARGRVILMATLLPLLFSAPIAIAIASGSFAWIVAAVISYWIRFRVAARSGEAIPVAFLHPVSALLASFLLFRWLGDHNHATTDELERTPE